jgi:hypothetical protein
MKLFFSSILLVLTLVTSSYSDEASHRASAEEFLLVMKTDQMMQPMYQEIRKMMFNMSKQMGIPKEESELFNRHVNRMINMLEDEFGWSKMKDDLIRIYQETYTENELKAFITFYKTPAGQKFIEKMPLLMKKSMEISQKNMPSMIKKMEVLQAKMFEDIQNEIAKKQAEEMNKKDSTEL